MGSGRLMTRAGKRLLKAPFECAIAVTGIASFLAWLIAPSEVEMAAVGQTAPGLLPVWECMFAAAGAGILGGLLLRSIRVEVAGLVLLTAALLINAISIVNFSGATGATSAATFTALVLASVSRAWFLIQGWRRVRVEE